MRKMGIRRKTSADYIKAVISAYEQRKMTMHEGLLIAPSPAALRDLCLAIYISGMPPEDERVFRTFFRLNDSEDIKKGIQKVDTERFRAVINFMKGASMSTDTKNLNLIAILVDFEERPLNRFLNDGKEVVTTVREKKRDSVLFTPDGNQVPEKRRKTALWIGICAIAATGIAALSMSGNGGKCMIWEGHSYKAVDCEDAAQSESIAEALKDGQFEINEINVGPNTTFFTNGKPIVWYLRKDGRYEFFDHPGHHPIEIHKELKPISRTIAMQVVAGKIIADY